MKNHCRVLLTALSIGVTGISFAEDWPQWRGINRDAKSAETGLLKQWPEAGPEVKWRIENVGVGYSSISVVDGKIYTMGDLNGVEHLLAFEESTGNRIWALQPEPVEADLEQQIDEQFKRLDINEDGKVDEFELLERNAFQNAQYDAQDSDADIDALAAKRSTALIKHFDKNSDGSLGIAEIPSGFGKDLRNIDRPSGSRREMTSIADKRVAATLAALDQDSNGLLDKTEYKKTILSNSSKKIDQPKDGEKKGDSNLTAEELKSYFTKSERLLDGVLSQEELTNYYRTNLPGRDGVLTRDDVKGSVGGYRNGQGDGPRGTPTVVGNRLFTEGGKGDVTCLDRITGKTIWHTNLQDDLGGKRPGWGYSESPLVVENRVFITPGSKDGCLFALNKETGEVIWKSGGNIQGAHYASPMLATIAGVKQIVQFGRESMFGLDYTDGDLLWTYKNAANGTANCSTAVIDGDLVLAASAYGTGGGVAKISAQGDQQKADQVWFEKKLQNHHGGLVKVGDYVYGFGSGGLICIEFKSGEIKWSDKSVGKGSLIYADGMLYCLGERHEVALVEANPESYVEKGRFKIETQGRPSWAHPVIANGVFYIRDQHTLTAYSIK